MKCFHIFKRRKNKYQLPDPRFDDNWKQDQYEKNVDEGAENLRQGKEIIAYDDGRAFELVCDIKKRFLENYKKQLAERIEIKQSNNKYLVRWRH